jgi:DNA-binding response OmpR family regulator
MNVIRPFVLCVEDDLDTREMLQILLEERGYAFKAVDTCAEALRFMRENKVDLLLLDNLLPDGNGIELCQQVRLLNKHLPIVFLSGSTYGDEREVALQIGANAFLSKPLEIKKLFDTLAEYAPI